MEQKWCWSFRYINPFCTNAPIYFSAFQYSAAFLYLPEKGGIEMLQNAGKHLIKWEHWRETG